MYLRSLLLKGEGREKRMGKGSEKRGGRGVKDERELEFPTSSIVLYPQFQKTWLRH